MTEARRRASALVTALMAATAGLAFHRVFDWHGVIPVVTVAAVLPAALALGLAFPQKARPLALSLAVGWGAWLVVASETLYRGDLSAAIFPTLAGFHALLVGLRDSWKAIATTILPAPDRPDLLVLVSALVWAAALAGAELALRTRSVILPAAPAALVFVVALLLGVDGAGSNLPLAAGFALLGGVLVVARSPEPLLDTGSVSGAVSVCAIAAAAGVLGPSLPFLQGRQPFDVRQRLTPPPPTVRTSANPLDEVQGWLLQNPSQTLFTVRTPVQENWRLAVLDRFDGTGWSASSTFVATGSRVPPPAAAPPVTSLGQDVTIANLRGPWLPAADRPASVTGVAVDVDPITGTLMSSGQLLTGTSYHVLSEVPVEPSLTDLRSAAPAADAEARSDLALWGKDDSGGVPPILTPGRSCVDPSAAPAAELRCWAETASAGSTFPLQQAVQMQDFLLHSELYDPSAPPGHSFRNLEFFLATTHRGTSEQFAATFALMARALGLPSRIVVGFRSGHRLADTWEVERGDAMVWPEVDFRGLGWVPFYPTPDSTTQSLTGGGVPVGESANRRNLDAQVEEAVAVAVPTPAPPRPRRHPDSGLRSTSAPNGGLVAGALGTAASLYLLLVLGVPRLRRWRRRRRLTAGGRVLGAWEDVLESLCWLGVRSGRGMTVTEVVAAGAGVIDTSPAAHLAPIGVLVNTAGFAAKPADEAQALAAWAHRDAIVAGIDGARGGFRGLWKQLDPRGLLMASR